MKKLFFIAFMGLNIAIAEESGGFVGLEVGYGEAEIVNIRSVIPISKDNIRELDFNGGGVAYGFTIGYKQFFTPYLGLRYYANLNLLHANLNPKSTRPADGVGGRFIVNAKKSSVMLLNYGANMDFMANVLASENVDFGGFVGVGLGGDSWMGKGIEHQLWLYRVHNYFSTAHDLKLNSKTNFNVWINVGLRTNFAKYHGIELVARAPFLKNKLLDGNFVDRYDGQVKAKVTIKGIYSVSLRYTVSF